MALVPTLFVHRMGGIIADLFQNFFKLNLKAQLDDVTKEYKAEYAISCHICFYDLTIKQGGVVILNFPEEVVRSLCKIMMKMDISTREENEQFLRELANILVSKMNVLLEEQGHETILALPNIIQNNDTIQLSTSKRDDFHYLNFEGPDTRFRLAMSIYELVEFT